VAKAALEAAVRYIAAELGPKGIRVHVRRDRWQHARRRGSPNSTN